MVYILYFATILDFSVGFGAGVSIIENDESGIVMELEMNWDANPSIILDVKTRLGVSLPIQVIYFMLLVVLCYEYRRGGTEAFT